MKKSICMAALALVVTFGVAARAKDGKGGDAKGAPAVEGKADAKTIGGGNKPCPDGQKPPCGTPGLDAKASAKGAAAVKKPKFPVVGDPKLIAGATVIGGPGSTGGGNPTNLTENKCTQNGCTVVCGQGPSYATWCRCGGTGAQTFTYIHD